MLAPTQLSTAHVHSTASRTHHTRAQSKPNPSSSSTSTSKAKCPASTSRASVARKRRALLLKPTTPPVPVSIRANAKRSSIARASKASASHSDNVFELTFDEDSLRKSSSSRSSKAFASNKNKHVFSRRKIQNVHSGHAANKAAALKLPEFLKHPTIDQDTNVEALMCAGYGDDLRHKGVRAVAQDVSRDGDRMFRAISRTTVAPISADEENRLPSSATISIPDSTDSKHAPTHMLAVHSVENKDDNAASKVTVFPIHSQVLAVSCPRVPTLPISEPTVLGSSITRSSEDPFAFEETKDLEVPLVPFAIPSPTTFGHLLQFLYTHSFPAFLSILLPLEPARSYAGLGPEYDPEALARCIAEQWTGSAIMSAAMRVYGIWQNACSLGVRDEKLWLAIDIAWRAYRDAMLLARR